MADATAAAPVAAPAPAAAPAPVAAPAAAPAAPAAAPAPAAAAPAAAPPADPGIRFGDNPPADDATKTDEVKADDAKTDDATKTDAPVYDLKLPDGATLSEEAIAGVKEKFAAANVPPDQAQALFDAHVEGLKTAMQTATQTLLDNWATTKAAWEGEIKADPEIGGAKLDQSIASIRKGAETLLGPKAAKAFHEALDTTGAGSHPAMVKALFKAFSIHAPATNVSGAPAGAKEARTAGATLYPTQAGLGNKAIN